MHPYNLNCGLDSLQYLQIAENLLETRDLFGTKSYALKAQESDPNSESANQILTIVDTLIAGEKQISSNNFDWYSILQLAPRTHDSEVIDSHYKRLRVLLDPDRNRHAYAKHAYVLVKEAYSVLSNPSRKFQFDNEFGNSNATHFNFIQPQQRSQLISGSSGHFEIMEMQQGRNKQIGGSSGHFEGSKMQHQRNQQIGGSSGVHFNFMQGGIGGEFRQTAPMHFVQQQQQQQQVLSQQAIPQQDGQILTSQLHWSNQGKQALVRAQLQQTWFQQPEAQTHVQRSLPQSQPHVLHPQPHQPSHWAQSQRQSQLNKPHTKSRDQSTRPLHWSQHVPWPLPKTRKMPQQPLGSYQQVPQLPPKSQEQPQQTLHSPQHMPWPLPKIREQPQQPLHSSQHSSQPVPQVPSLSLPWKQESLPSPQIQTSSPEFGERVNNGEQFNYGKNIDNADNHENNVNVEEPASFWTACPYCYHMYEYASIYVDCTLRCQNCKKAIHAARVEAPPAIVEGEDSYIFCWGYFPIGVSMSDFEKRKAEASNWQPFSKMYVVPRGGNTPVFPQGGTEFAFPQGDNTSRPRNPWNSGPKIYIDDIVDDIFDDISSNDESDDDEDWRYAARNKKARRTTRKGATTKKVKSAEVVQDNDTGNLQSGVVAEDGSGTSVPDATVPIVPEARVRIVLDGAV